MLTLRLFLFISFPRTCFLESLGSNLLVKGGKLNIQLHPMFQTIADNLPETKREFALARTYQNVATKGKTPAFADVHPAWLRVVDDVRAYF